MNKELNITLRANTVQAYQKMQQFQKQFESTEQTIKRFAERFDQSGNVASRTFSIVERHGNQLIRTIQRIDKDGNLRNLSQSVTELRDNAEKTNSVFDKLRNSINLGLALGSFKLAFKGLAEVTTKAIDYSESLNLFNVVFKNIEENGETAFSNVGKSATEFQEKLQRNFGTDRTESMYFQGLYQSMAESQGILDKYANIMSENTTKLTYDISSLFNSNQEDTAEALRAGIFSGQTKPLRSYGIDITENTLQAYLDTLKQTNSALSDLTVSSMSQAEKQILRYMSVLNQATVAQGDFANTINSPANQLKILSNQIQELGVAVGNLFVGPLQKLLTFANTVVIVVKQVAQAIAGLFGIKLKDYNTGIASAGSAVEDLADAYDGVGSNAGKATKAVKELQRVTLKFDEINNINEPKDTSGGSGKGSKGIDTGISQALLDALKGYDNGLDKVRLKAQEIADKIMKWLGFEYDAEQGIWKLGKAYDNLLASVGRLNSAMKVLNGYTFDNLMNFYNHFLKPVASWTLGTGLPKFVDITANGIMKTDWANLNNKLDKFYKALAPFSINVGEGLLWFYEKVLVPLGSFTIGKIVPEFVDLLANGLNILNNTIDVIKPGINFLWDGFLSPIAKWTGGIALTTLQGINSVFNLISKSKIASTVTALGIAFTLANKNGGILKTSMTLLEKVLGKTSKSTDDTNKKTTLLNKAFDKLKSTTKDMVSPLGKLVTSIKNASKEEGKFSDKTKNFGTILDVFKSKTKQAGNSIMSFGDRLKGAKDGLKDTSTQLKNGINDWYNTTTGVEKFKTALVGITGAVASLRGVSDAMKDVTTNGANLNNVANLATSSIGTISSAMTTGASVGGVYGAAIGGVLGALGALISANNAYNEALEASSKVYETYKQKMDDLSQSYQESLANAQSNIASRQGEIEVSKNLANQLSELLTETGLVKQGEEERAKSLAEQLNKELGTNFELQGNVLSAEGEQIRSKQQFIDIINRSAEALEREMMMESYKAMYTEATKKRTEAEYLYNNQLQEQLGLLQDAMNKYKNGEIGLDELNRTKKKTAKEMEKAEKDYQNVLDQTKPVIGGLEKFTKAYAEGNKGKMKSVLTEVSNASTKSSDKIKANYKAMTLEVDKANSKIKKGKDEFDSWKSKTISLSITTSMDTSGAKRDWNKMVSSMEKASQGRGVALTYPNRIYANGGFPEEGPFYMNRGEIAGKFSNGKSVVANNQQITDGIKYAVMEGMAEVMSQYGGSQDVHLDIHADEGIIVKKAVEGINRITDTTGDCPIRVM